MTHFLTHRLGINPVLRGYLRPPWSSLGPLTHDQYMHHAPHRRLQIIKDHCEGIDEQLTPEQRILEFAGLLAKIQDQRILTFNQIKDIAHSRDSREKYEQYVGQQSPWAVDDYAYETLSPEFTEGWWNIYESMNASFGDVPQKLRRKFQRTLNPA